jgi:acetyl esterase/lipase
MGPPVSFYRVNDLGPGSPGELLRAISIPGPPGVQAWAVLYRSRGARDEDVVVSGVVAVPTGPAPSDGFPILTWAHGTTGLADACAPSRSGTGGWGPIQASFLDQGFIVAATDYEGLGTPGPHPYLVGTSAAHSVLDMARVARRIAPARAGSQIVIMGHSQGGHAALWAAELADSYAPDLHVIGTVAEAPALPTLDSPSVFNTLFILTILASWHEVYGASYTDILRPRGVAAVHALLMWCWGSLNIDASPRSLSAIPGQRDPWTALSLLNTPGGGRSSVPIMIVQGGGDPLIPASQTLALAQHLRQVGDTVEYLELPDANHVSVLPEAQKDVLAWISDLVEKSRHQE